MRLARRVRQLTPSTTLEMTARAKQLSLGGRAIVNFAAGELDFDTPEFIKQAAIEALKAGFTKYTPATGIAELKSAIAEKFQRENNLTYQPSQIVVSCGAKHSLFNLVQVLCDPGDEVIIPRPYWVSYPEMVLLAEGVPVYVPTRRENGFKITDRELRRATTARTRLFLLNSPCNPTGSVYSKEELSALAQVIVEKKIFCISDEIYEKFLYDGNEHYSIASFGKEIYEQTITVNGPSKSFAMTGWRIGYFGAPEWIAQAVGNYQSHSTSNPASISQKATLAALKGNPAEVGKLIAPLDKRRHLMMDGLGKIENLSFLKPQGAFYLFCQIGKTGLDSASLAPRLLEETGVVTVPGEAFGDKDSLRLSFATSETQIEEGIRRMAEFFRRIRS